MNRAITTVALLCLATGLSSCATTRSSKSFVAARALVWVEQDLSALVRAKAPKAFVMLDRSDSKRNKRICAAFSRLPSETLAKLNPNANAVPTYWLLKSAKTQGVDINNINCDKLIGDFDYTRAAQVANAFQIPNNGHPYIVAIDDKRNAFYIDIDKASDSQIDTAMTAWFSEAANNTDKSGVQYTVWWRAAATKLCKSSFVQTAVTSLLPGFVAPVLGLVIDQVGCKAEAQAAATS